MSRPFSSWRPPWMSETPMIFAPASLHILAAMDPTLPKPWTTMRDEPRVRPRRGAASRQRLASHDGGHRVAGVHGKGVHDPRHRLGVGAHVRSRNVLLGPELVHQLGRVPPGDPLDLAPRKRARI